MQRRSDELNHSRCESGKSGRGCLLCGGRECRLTLSEGSDSTAFKPFASRRTNGIQRTALSVVQWLYSSVQRYARWVRTSCLASGPNSQVLPRRSPRCGARCGHAKTRYSFVLNATFNMDKNRVCVLSLLLAICNVLPIFSMHYSKKLLPFSRAHQPCIKPQTPSAMSTAPKIRSPR